MNKSSPGLWFGIAAVVFSLGQPLAQAKVKTEVVEYKDGDTTLEGYLAYDDAKTFAKKPGVVIVHDWKGLQANAKMRAEMMAGLGYVAFAADIYGKGVRPQTNEEAKKIATSFKDDRALLRRRADAALAELKKNKQVAPNRIVAMGYCFGGTTVLEMARGGAPLAAVVSFHGGLSTATPDDAKNIKGKVLVLTGADDPSVPATEVSAFEDEMRKGSVDYQVVEYGGAVHAFTIKEAGNDNSKGAAYNEKADKRSWQAMKDFFSEVLQPKG
jgi:dienelactone hydrolase